MAWPERHHYNNRGGVMNVSLEDAYNEACRQLGEALVKERLLLQEVARLTAADPPTGDVRTADS